MARAQIALLNQSVDALKAQLAAVSQALDLAQAQGRDKDAQIANLGQKLNAALAAKVQELQQYRSEFFGKLRQVLEDGRAFRSLAIGSSSKARCCFRSAVPT